MKNRLNSFSRQSFVALFAVASLLWSQGAIAGSIECHSVDEDLRVSVQFAKLDLQKRDWRIDLISMSVAPFAPNRAREPIAEFIFADGVLAQAEQKITGIVNSNYRGTSHARRRIAGTTLGKLAQISLSIDWSFHSDSSGGDKYSGVVYFSKKTGEVLQQDFDCFLTANPSQVGFNVAP